MKSLILFIFIQGVHINLTPFAPAEKAWAGWPFAINSKPWLGFVSG